MQNFVAEPNLQLKLTPEEYITVF